MKIYIASSWKNQHAVEMLTALLRERGHEVLSFVENNHGEHTEVHELAQTNGNPEPFETWVWGDRGTRSFTYDTDGATKSDLVIYISPSGLDAWAEVGAAWASGRPIIGIRTKGELVGLMRRMVMWVADYREALETVDGIAKSLIVA